MAITGGITLLQKLQKLFGARAVSDMMGRTTNVQTLAQGQNNPFALSFSKKYLKKNPDGVEEASKVIMENMQFAFGNKNPQQMKNFQNNVDTLFEIKFPPAKAEAQIVDLSTKEQVTGKGIESLKDKMGLPEGVSPNSSMGKLLMSQNRKNKSLTDIENVLDDLDNPTKFTNQQARQYSANIESYRRPIIRQMLLKDTRIKLPDNVRKSLENKMDLDKGADSKMDPLRLLNEYYDVNFAKLDELEDIRFTARNETEAADEFLKKGGLEPKKDLGDKLKDLSDDIDPDAMAQGGIAGQLHLNRTGYDMGGNVSLKDFEKYKKLDSDGGIKISPNINITKTGSTPYTGIDQSVTDRNYGVSGLLESDNKYIGGNISKGNVKVEVQKDGNTVFNDTLPKEKAAQIYAGLGERHGNNVEVATDMEGNYTFRIKSFFNQGGRVGLQEGGLPTVKSVGGVPNVEGGRIVYDLGNGSYIYESPSGYEIVENGIYTSLGTKEYSDGSARPLKHLFEDGIIMRRANDPILLEQQAQSAKTAAPTIAAPTIAAPTIFSRTNTNRNTDNTW